MSPRSLPPEMSANLTAMRELANMNARTAIHTHLRRQTSDATSSTSIVAVVGLLTAGVMGWFWQEGTEWALYGALGGIGVAVVWGFRYIVFRFRVKKKRREVDAHGNVTTVKAE
jgi:hypothetical protein